MAKKVKSMAFLQAVIYILALFALQAWFVMLLIGGLHAQIAIVPALNYIGSFFLVWLSQILIKTQIKA